MFPGLIFGSVGLIGTIIFHSLERVDIVYEVIEESFKILGVSFFFSAYFLTLLSLLGRLDVRLSLQGSQLDKQLVSGMIR